MKRDTILIFEDNEIDRAILVGLLQSDYCSQITRYWRHLTARRGLRF